MDTQIDNLLKEKSAFLTELQENLMVDDILAVKELVEKEINKAEDQYREFMIQVNRNWLNIKLAKNELCHSSQVPRGVGKTTALVKKADAEGKVLIVPSKSIARHLKQINSNVEFISVVDVNLDGSNTRKEYLVDDISHDDYNSLVNSGLKITGGFVC